jgi:hypothetical protein
MQIYLDTQRIFYHFRRLALVLCNVTLHCTHCTIASLTIWNGNMLPNIYRHSCNFLSVKKCLLSPTARRRRDEVRQDFCQHRRSGEFGYHNVPRSGRLGGGRCPSDDWRSVGGGGRGRRDRCYGDVELTDFGLIDYPRLSAAEKVSNNTGGGGGNSKSPATSVRKGLLWVQKDRFFSRYTGFVSVYLETSVLLYDKRLISSHYPDGD